MENLKGMMIMEKPWLIQRLQKPFKNSGMIVDMINSLSFGGGLVNGGISEEALELIKDIFRFDYMGSAEFEWGAVPEALNIIARNHEKNVAFETEVRTREGTPMVVYMVCNGIIRQEVEDWVKNKAFDEYDGDRTKEGVWLQRAINNGGEFAGVCGWLELNNGFFFFTDKEMFEKTRKLFGVNMMIEVNK